MKVRQGGESPSGKRKGGIRPSDAPMYFRTLACALRLRPGTPAHPAESIFCIVPVCPEPKWAGLPCIFSARPQSRRSILGNSATKVCAREQESFREYTEQGKEVCDHGGKRFMEILHLRAGTGDASFPSSSGRCSGCGMKCG